MLLVILVIRGLCSTDSFCNGHTFFDVYRHTMKMDDDDDDDYQRHLPTGYDPKK